MATSPPILHAMIVSVSLWFMLLSLYDEEMVSLVVHCPRCQSRPCPPFSVLFNLSFFLSLRPLCCCCVRV